VTITTNTGFDTASVAPAVGVMELVELAFTSGTLYLTTWPVNVTIGAQVYTGIGGLGGVGEIKESEDGQTQTLQLTLSQVNASNLSLALGNASSYQGRSARVLIALTDANLRVTGSPVLRFSGFMDKVSIKRQTGNVGQIVLECATGGFDVRKSPNGLRMNDVQHQSRHPGEIGLAYVQGLISNPQLWLSKRFQQV
jgi:hypothetical protein